MPKEFPPDTAADSTSVSRRDFLRRAALAPLILPGGGLLWLPPGQQKSAQKCGCNVLPPLGGAVSYDAHCFTIAGRDRLLFSASMHYPRVPRELWRDRLLKLRRAGINTIETVVFWNYHELEPGRFDLEEFDAYCQLIGEMGLWMIARPGPYICAEWATGGFPDWLIARRFPLRSPDPRNVAASQRWFNQVLPVIRRHQAPDGGPIVLMQIENEYDYWPLPDAEKVAYLSQLAGMAWQAGIKVPLFTNWGKQTRERDNPVMARLFDTCDFYPRWNVKDVIGPLRQLRHQVPNAPLSVAELQGGWFAQVGGRLSIDQPGIGPEQLATLTRLVLGEGVTYLNYYMGHGGSNFNWAGQNLTSTYDYAAPVREGGWLWEKYYAMRELGMMLEMTGESLARASLVKGAAELIPHDEATAAEVDVTLRVHDETGFLFLRELRNQPRRLALKLNWPTAAPVGRFPAHGEIELPAHAARLLPLNWELNGRRLIYSTAEVAAAARSGGRELVLLSGEPGETVEAVFAAPQAPRKTAGSQWDAALKGVRVRARVGSRLRSLLLEWDQPRAELQVFFAPRSLARRSWLSRLDAPSPAKTEGALLWLGDAALLESSTAAAASVRSTLQFTPGKHRMSVAVPQPPLACRVEGQPQQFSYDRRAKVAQFELAIPSPPAGDIQLYSSGTAAANWETVVQPVAVAAADPELPSLLPPLQRFGRLPYGYVIYEAEFRAEQAGDAAELELELHCAGGMAQVFVNDRHASETWRVGARVGCDVSALLKPGINHVAVCYEMFGAHNFGHKIADLKGLKSAALGPAGRKTPIARWRMQRFPACVDAGSRGRDLRAGFNYSLWPAPQPIPETTAGYQPGMLWTRRSFQLPRTSGWFLPWELHLAADGDALIYVNRRFVGRYAAVGPQSEFYLPEPWLRFGGANELALLLAYRRSSSGLKRVELRPIAGAPLCRRRIEWRFRGFS